MWKQRIGWGDWKKNLCFFFINEKTDDKRPFHDAFHQFILNDYRFLRFLKNVGISNVSALSA